MTMGPGPVMMGGPGPDSSISRQQIKSGTLRRILPYAKAYRWKGLALLVATVFSAATTVVIPILLKYLIDDGVLRGRTSVVVWIAVAVAGMAVLSTVLGWIDGLYSAQISEGLIYRLRTEVFDHVQRQPVAFFTRAQTGALVSRVNTDTMGAQQAITQILSTVAASVVTLVLVLIAMIVLSWQITLLSLGVLPLFVLPGKVVGRRLARLTRESMQINAQMGSMMQERFNVTGALLAKLYGRPEREISEFSSLAARGRDIGVVTALYGRMLFLSVALISSLAIAVVYGVGGALAIHGAFEIGTLVALATLLTRLFGPVNMLSTAQANVMTALVSFDRLFEVLDLKPLIVERPGAVALPLPPAPALAPDIEFENVSFRYPAAGEVSLASLEALAPRRPERADDGWILRDVSFRVPAGGLVALVGPSGAGKSTICQLVPRLYDPIEGTIRIGGHDLRDVTFDSLRDTVGVVTQDAHLYHQSIRDNLLFARPTATERELEEACRGAQILDLIQSLPNGFDTIAGDRGYRLSGGEKQRIAMARLLLKAPPVVVLDEATAHLDSESEAALQRALNTALRGRTSLVIAHRLSTVREADLILVLDGGSIRERGTHQELLELDGLYAELYRTQFASHPGNSPAPDSARQPVSALVQVGPGPDLDHWSEYGPGPGFGPGPMHGPGLYGPGPGLQGPRPNGPGPDGPGPYGPGSLDGPGPRRGDSGSS